MELACLVMEALMKGIARGSLVVHLIGDRLVPGLVVHLIGDRLVPGFVQMFPYLRYGNRLPISCSWRLVSFNTVGRV